MLRNHENLHCSLNDEVKQRRCPDRSTSNFEQVGQRQRERNRQHDRSECDEQGIVQNRNK